MKSHLTRLANLLHRPLRLVQLGAGTGDEVLPVLTQLEADGLKLDAVLVEPIGRFCNELSERSVRLPYVRTVRCAVNTLGEPAEFHFLKPSLSDMAPQWLRTLSATDATLFCCPQLPELSTETEVVPAFSLDRLLKFQGMKPDALLLDRQWQGQTIGVQAERPMLVRIIADRSEHAAIAESLRPMGYQLEPITGETIWAWRGQVPLPMQEKIHQIWLGGKPLTDEMKRWQESIRTHFPNHAYHLWDDERAANILPFLMCPDLCLHPQVPVGMRADVLRYNIMRLFGGVYFDTDFEILRPFDHHLVEGCVHFGFELPDRPAIGFLASPAGHAFWQFLLTRLSAVQPCRPSNVWDTVNITGPQAFARAFHEWTKHNRALNVRDERGIVAYHWPAAQMVGFTRETIYPYYFQEKPREDFRATDYPRAYAAHHWLAGWANHEEDQIPCS